MAQTQARTAQFHDRGKMRLAKKKTVFLLTGVCTRCIFPPGFKRAGPGRPNVAGQGGITCLSRQTSRAA